MWQILLTVWTWRYLQWQWKKLSTLTWFFCKIWRDLFGRGMVGVIHSWIGTVLSSTVMIINKKFESSIIVHWSFVQHFTLVSGWSRIKSGEDKLGCSSFYFEFIRRNMLVNPIRRVYRFRHIVSDRFWRIILGNIVWFSRVKPRDVYSTAN